MVREAVKPLGWVQVESGEGSVVRWGGEKDDIGATVIAPKATVVAGWLRTRNTSFDSHSITCRWLSEVSI
jgi:hypothetical protein